ncbi:MAG: hypothetical protein MUD08_08645 [Cytophagales bacterium]|jgi:cell division protein FtsW (lipid II flippase)|nr:hypothetical protein [Cytophagales bacterium]
MWRWTAAGTVVWLAQTVDFAPRLAQLQRMETHFNEFILSRVLLAAGVGLAAAFLVSRTRRRSILMRYWLLLFIFGLFCLLFRIDDLFTG